MHTFEIILFLGQVFTLLGYGQAAGRQWTPCNRPCDGGERHETSHQQTWGAMTCNDFPCNQEVNAQTKPTDITFVVDRSANVGEINDWKMKQRIIDFINGLDATVKPSEKSGVRFAYVSFDNSAKVEFNFFNRYSLANVDELKDKIFNMQYNPTQANTNLAAALNLADEVFDRSNPENNQHAYIFSFNDASVNQGGLNQAINRVHRNFRSVYAVGIGYGWGDEQMLQVVKDDEERATRLVEGGTVKRDLPEGGLKKRVVYERGVEIRDVTVVVQIVVTWRQVIVRITVTVEFPADVVTCTVTFVSTCSKACGVGFISITVSCTASLFGTQVGSFTVTYQNQCCIVPCSIGGGGGGTPCQGLSPGGP